MLELYIQNGVDMNYTSIITKFILFFSVLLKLCDLLKKITHVWVLKYATYDLFR